MKSPVIPTVQIRSFIRSVFSRIGTKYRGYGINLHIQPQCWKIRTRKIFFHAVIHNQLYAWRAITVQNLWKQSLDQYIELDLF